VAPVSHAVVVAVLVKFGRSIELDLLDLAPGEMGAIRPECQAGAGAHDDY
jgi:hypothetical protein